MRIKSLFDCQVTTPGNLSMRQLKWKYDRSPDCSGFFWPTMNEQKIQDYFSVKKIDYNRTKAVYQCDPQNDGSAIFVPEDFTNRFTPPTDLYLGRYSPLVVDFIKRGEFLIQSWDTALSASPTSDHSVCVTGLYVPDNRYLKGEDSSLLGDCEHYYKVYILDIFRQRLSFTQVIQEIKQQYLKWQPSKVLIEKKASGGPAIDSLSGSIPIEPIVPSLSKAARVVEGVGASHVQGWFRLGRVLLPSQASWVDDYVSEFVDFSGDRNGVDDQVDATVYLIQDAIKACGNSAILPEGFSESLAEDEKVSQSKEICGGGFYPDSCEVPRDIFTSIQTLFIQENKEHKNNSSMENFENALRRIGLVT